MALPSGAVPYGSPAGGPPPARRSWWILPVVAIAAIAVVGVVLWVLLPRYGGRAGYWLPYGGFFVVFLVLWLSFMVVRVAWWGSRRERYRAARAASRYGNAPAFDPAVRVARMRYARGEITRDEYDQIVRNLRPGPPLPPTP